MGLVISLLTLTCKALLSISANCSWYSPCLYGNIATALKIS